MSKEQFVENESAEELTEATLVIDQPLPSPEEEYREAKKKRRGKAALAAMLVLAEAFLGLLLLGTVVGEDLHFRVTRQIENDLTGKNVFSTGEYVGETDFGYFTGSGFFTYRTGSAYAGQWGEGRIQGIGRLNVPDEGTYKGEFDGSQKSGRGIFVWSDGSVYRGEWEHDQMSGRGVYVGKDGVRYVGSFKNNRFWQGDCTFSDAAGRYTVKFDEFEITGLAVAFADGGSYDGGFDGEFANGTGTMLFSNGDQYVGEFVKGARSGRGVYTWKSGDKYDGSWANDSISGSGIYTYADGSTAQGKFEDDQFVEGSYKVVNSFGEYTFTVESHEVVSVVMVLSTGTEYSGDMQDGKLSGSAQISYGNGDKYDGSVIDGRKSGEGTYTWSSGAWYEGSWNDDKMDGKGTYYYPEDKPGYKLTGGFVGGSPNGECWYYVDSSESYKTDWVNGQCVKVYE